MNTQDRKDPWWNEKTQRTDAFARANAGSNFQTSSVNGRVWVVAFSITVFVPIVAGCLKLVSGWGS